MNIPPEPARIFFFDLPVDAFNAFVSLRNQLEDNRSLDKQYPQDQEGFTKAGMAMITSIQENVQCFPELVNAVDENGRSLLALAFHMYSFGDYVLSDPPWEPCGEKAWKDVIKYLIDKNPHALSWNFVEQGRDRRRHYESSPENPLTKILDLYEATNIVEHITRHYSWIFGLISINVWEGGEETTPAKKWFKCKFNPFESLLGCHTRGHAPAWAVKSFFQSHSQALWCRPFSTSILHCCLLGHYVVCCPRLFKWIGEQVPGAMLAQNQRGRTPLLIACKKLARGCSTGTTVYMTNICLFLISECPESLVVPDDKQMYPLCYLASATKFGENALVKRVVVEAIKKLHDLFPGISTLPSRHKFEAGEGPILEGHSLIQEINDAVQKRSRLRLEALQLRDIGEYLKSSGLSALGEAYSCWSSPRQATLMGTYDSLVETMNVQVDKIVIKYSSWRVRYNRYPWYHDDNEEWREEEYSNPYNPFEDWRLNHD